jgi:hypothetical protein
MVNFGDVGIICLNCDITGACRGCLWREWDSGKQHCRNCHSPICPEYRERLFTSGYQAPLRAGSLPGYRPLT